MTSESDLQEVLRQNLRVLLAMRRMTHAELATQIGSDRSTIAKRMNGHRDWSLQDLAVLADVFGVTAQELIGDPATLVGAVYPARTATPISAGVSERCPRTNPRVVIPFPQIRGTRRGYRSRRTLAAIKRGVRPAAAMNTGHPYAAPVA